MNAKYDRWCGAQTGGIAMLSAILLGAMAIATPCRASISLTAERNDDALALVYDSRNGNLFIRLPDKLQLTSLSLKSESGLFRADRAAALTLEFPADKLTTNELFHVQPDLFHTFTLPAALPPGLSSDRLALDLWAVGTGVASEYFSWELQVVPEPEAAILVATGVLYAWCVGRERRSPRSE